MTILLIVIGFVLIILIGFWGVYTKYSSNKEKNEFAEDYRHNFVSFANKYNKNDFDNELYVWLTKNIDKIQTEIGIYGLSDYKPPHSNRIIRDYPIILNTVPQFREGRAHEFDIGSVNDSLLRYLGVLEIHRENKLKELKNPLIWFRTGFQKVISLPILLLYSFGIITERTVNRIVESSVFKLISGLTGFILTLYGIFCLITDWDRIVDYVKSIFL